MDSRPQTLVYKLVIAASKKVVRPNPIRRGDVSGRLGPTGVGLGACFYLYYRCCIKVKCELGFAWMDRMDRIWMLVVGGDVGGVVVWLVCPAPPRALTLTLSHRAGEGIVGSDLA